MHSLRKKLWNRRMVFFLLLQIGMILIVNILLNRGIEGEISVADRILNGFLPLNMGVFLLPMLILLTINVERYSSLKDSIIRYHSRKEMAIKQLIQWMLIALIFTLLYQFSTLILGLAQGSLINWEDPASFFTYLHLLVLKVDFSWVFIVTSLSYYFIQLNVILLFHLVYLIFDKYIYSWVLLIYTVVWDIFEYGGFPFLLRRFQVDYSYFIDEVEVLPILLTGIGIGIVLSIGIVYTLNKKDYL